MSSLMEEAARDMEAALAALTAPAPEMRPPQPLALTARELAVYVAQLGRIVSRMQRKMDEMALESAQRVTVSHAQALQLQRMIRERTAAICRQYGLSAGPDAAAFRAAIKKEVLSRHGVRDLHDLPIAALPGAREQIGRYADFGLVMERRRTHGTADSTAGRPDERGHDGTV